MGKQGKIAFTRVIANLVWKTSSLAMPHQLCLFAFVGTSNKANRMAKITFFDKTKNPKLCTVAATICIICRAASLGQNSGHPLDICASSNPSIPFPIYHLCHSHIIPASYCLHTHDLTTFHPNILAWSTLSIHVPATIPSLCEFLELLHPNLPMLEEFCFTLFYEPSENFYFVQCHMWALMLHLNCLLSPPGGLYFPNGAPQSNQYAHFLACSLALHTITTSLLSFWFVPSHGCAPLQSSNPSLLFL